MITLGLRLNSGFCCKHITSDVECLPTKVFDRSMTVINLDTGEVLKNRGMLPVESLLLAFEKAPIKSKMELALA